MQKNDHLKIVYLLCAVLAFAGAACGIAYYNLRTAGSLYLQSDDGDLYLSIARNLLQNAHFIQTARPIEAFVVPPGLPAVVTMMLFLTGGLSEFLVHAGFCAHLIGQAGADMLGLLGFQYILYGLASVFMAVTALKLAFHGLDAAQQGIFVWSKQSGQDVPHPVPKPLPWVLAVLTGIAVPAFYVYCSVQIRHPNPGFILTENYVVFLIAWIIWLVVKGSDIRGITAAAFILTLFRPACSPLLLMAFGWMVIRAFHDRFAKKKPPIRERIRFYDLFVLLAVFALVIGLNTGINYLETGEIIPLEDYSSMDVYLANNDKAGPEWYHSGKVPEFASTRYNQIALNESLTRYRQNELAKEALSEYVKANTETVLHNAAVRYERLFCQTWGPVFYAFLACLLLQILLKGLRWPQKVYLLLAAIFLSVMPAFGLLVARYSAPMFPLFIAVTAGTIGQLVCIIATREKKEAVPAIAAEPVAEKTEEPVPEKEEEKAKEPAPEAVAGEVEELASEEAIEGPVVEIPGEGIEETVPESIEDKVEKPAVDTVEEDVEETVIEVTEEPAAELPIEIIEEAVLEENEEIPAESVEETVGEPIEETVEETIEEPAEEVVEIEEPEADVPMSEAVKTMSAHDLARKLFAKKPDPLK